MDVPLLIETPDACFAFWSLFRGACSFKIVIRKNSGQLKPEVCEVFES